MYGAVSAASTIGSLTVVETFMLLPESSTVTGEIVTTVYFLSALPIISNFREPSANGFYVAHIR